MRTRDFLVHFASSLAFSLRLILLESSLYHHEDVFTSCQSQPLVKQNKSFYYSSYPPPEVFRFSFLVLQQQQ